MRILTVLATLLCLGALATAADKPTPVSFRQADWPHRVAINIMMLEMMSNQAANGSAPTPVNAPTEKPSTEKVCPCSDQCACGCNEGEVCECNSGKTRSSSYSTSPDVPETRHYSAPAPNYSAPRYVPAPSYRSSPPRFGGGRFRGGRSGGGC